MMHSLEFIEANKHQQSAANFEALVSIFQLRKQVFVDRLKWQNGYNQAIYSISGMEFDQFDTLPSTYFIIHRDNEGKVDGAARLHPTHEPHLLGDIFPHLVENYSIIRSPKVWEVSRFCSSPTSKTKNITNLLVCGLIEFSLYYALKNLVSVTDIRIEPILDKTGWRRKRLGKTFDTGTDIAAAEIYEVEQRDLLAVRKKLGIDYNLINFEKSYIDCAA